MELDRLSRSLRAVLTIMERLGESGAGFRSLTEAIDTTTPAGRMMMQMVGAFAEFERAMLKERTQAGLDAAREEGCVGGPPEAFRSPRATRLRPTLAACSKFTPQPFRRYSLNQVRGRSAAPNSAQRPTPDNFDRDCRRMVAS